MKRSSNVTAPILASAALAFLAACRKPEMQRCVDEHDMVVDDSLCTQPRRPNPAGGFYPNPFRFYYGGWGGYTPGSFIGGGGYAPMTGHSYSSSTSRGGFGSSFHSSGSGGGE